MERAIALDPNYGLAWAGLADAYTILGYYSQMSPEDAGSNARRAALRALEVGPDLGEAHCARAMVSLMFDWDLDAAERGFKRAMELNPGHIQGASWYHLFYLGFLSGRWNEAFEGLLALEKREPLSAYIASVLSIGHSAEGRDPAQALHWATRALELDPIAFNPLWARQLALAINGDLSKAIEAGDFALAMSGRAPLALPPLAVALVENGEMDHARSVYEEMRSRSRRDVFAPTGMAAVAAALGDNEAAIEFAREAFRRHDPQLPIASTNFRYGQHLRALPEFQEIVKTLKLPGWNGARAGELRTGPS